MRFFFVSILLSVMPVWAAAQDLSARPYSCHVPSGTFNMQTYIKVRLTESGPGLVKVAAQEFLQQNFSGEPISFPVGDLFEGVFEQSIVSIDGGSVTSELGGPQKDFHMKFVFNPMSTDPNEPLFGTFLRLRDQESKGEFYCSPI